MITFPDIFNEEDLGCLIAGNVNYKDFERSGAEIETHESKEEF